MRIMRHSSVLVWTCSSSGVAEAGFLGVYTAGVPDFSPFQTVKGGGSGLLLVSCRIPNLSLPVTIPPAQLFTLIPSKHLYFVLYSLYTYSFVGYRIKM